MRDGLLVRHFLNRFLDHDLISPHADRREVLTVTAAGLVVSALFLSVFLAVKYQFNLFMPPGLTSVFALDDRFFFISLSMIVMGLAAVAEWDSLVLDTRDAAVLGPLPVPLSMIVRAKFIAVALFAVGFDFALNVGPTIVRPAALPVSLPVTLPGALWLAFAHALCATAAGAFGFLAVLAIREACRAVMPPALFRRLSPTLQAGLVLLLVTALLLLPGAYSKVAATWLTNFRVTPAVVPPLWFVGFHEMIAGRIIDGLPRGVPPKAFARAEYQATALYRQLWPAFHRLAVVGALAIAGTLVVAVAACIWNNRRLPSPGVPQARSRWLNRLFVRIATRLVARRPSAQAGFFFAVQTLARSVPHRVTMTASIAVALSLFVITFHATTLSARLTLSAISSPMLALQTLVLVTLLTAFRHVIRIPADARATWTLQLAWSGDERPYLSGVKRAALLILAAPTLCGLGLLQMRTFGPAIGLAHALTGCLIALIVVEWLFMGCRTIPFASPYERAEDLKSVAPIYVVGTLIAAMIVARIERAAFGTAVGATLFFAVLAALVVVSRRLGARHASDRIPIATFDDVRDGTQCLGLT